MNRTATPDRPLPRTRWILPLSLLLLASAALPGCVYPYTTRPGVTGTVVDARRHRPLPGAAVTLGRVGSSAAPATVRTAADGRFAFRVRKVWEFWPPFDPFPSNFALSVQHAGYVRYETTLLSYPLGNKPSVRPLGEIQLTPHRSTRVLPK